MPRTKGGQTDPTSERGQATSHSPSVQLAQISHRYPGQKEDLLSDINLNLQGSGLFWVTGENGVGKTTFLRILCSLQTPSSGHVTYSGFKMRPPLSIGWMDAEASGFLWNLTGRENIQMFAQLKSSEWRPELKRDLENLNGYKEALDTPFHKCSTGMKKMLLLTNALLHTPQLLILDEPFTGIDNSNTSQLCTLLTHLAQSCLVIYTSHERAIENSQTIHISRGSVSCSF